MTRPKKWRAFACWGVWSLCPIAVIFGSASAKAQLVEGGAATAPPPALPASSFGGFNYSGLFPAQAGTAQPSPQAGAAGYNGVLSAQTGAGQPNLQLPPRSALALTPVGPGADPVQKGNDLAPAILIRPSITLLQGLDDNPRNTPSHLVDSLTEVTPGIAISADTPRLQGQLSYSLDLRKYARATDQDALNQNLATYDLGTVVPGLLYVDGRAAMSQLSTTGGFAFTNPSAIPVGQSTQVTTASISPILQKTFGDTIDTQVRYIYGLSDFSNPSLSGGVSPSLLSNITENEINAVAATHGYGIIASRLTMDGTQISSQSVARSTQLRVYDDLEYRINQQFSLLGRLGYENLRFPLDPLATVTGPTWLIGGRVNGGSGSSASLEYGLIDGVYGLTGNLNAQLTAATSVLASYQHSRSSPQQQILSNLNGSRLGANGSSVNQQSGLPTGLGNLEFPFSTNSVYSYSQLRFGAQTAVGRNTFGAFAFLDSQTSLVAGTPSARGRGVNLTWGRSITPRLTGSASVGYAQLSAAGGTSWTADVALTYAINDNFNGILRYSFYDTEGSTAISSTSRDILEVGLSRTF